MKLQILLFVVFLLLSKQQAFAVSHKSPSGLVLVYTIGQRSDLLCYTAAVFDSARPHGHEPNRAY